MTPDDPPEDWPPLETKRARLPPSERMAWPGEGADGPGRDASAPHRRPEAAAAPRDGDDPEADLDDATRAQVLAADPDASAWVSANAGSGKTRVLTDRVARLLLRGVSPGRVLCLTYTKAAASEMQLRLFRRLGAWSMLDDAGLIAQMRHLGADTADAAVDLAHARRLFAQAIETPGGLKIQTIHAFCAALLRRFPLEAGVSPRFQEMDEAAAHALRGEVLEEIADGPARADLDAVAQRFTGESLDELVLRILSMRDTFERSDAPLDAALGLPAGLDADTLAARVFMGVEADLLAEVARRMAEGGGKTDARQAPEVAALARGPLDAAAPARAGAAPADGRGREGALRGQARQVPDEGRPHRRGLPRGRARRVDAARGGGAAPCAWRSRRPSARAPCTASRARSSPPTMRPRRGAPGSTSTT